MIKKNNNNVKAARRYDPSRQQVQRRRKKYDGTVESLTNQSGRPHSHPNQAYGKRNRAFEQEISEP